jgi:hypothetical protein
VSDPELGPANRRAKRRRTLVPGACPCGETDPVALRELDGAAICAHCLAVAQGRSPIERHHVLGRANGPTTVAIDVNEHDRLSDRQRDWPTDTLRNLRRSAHRRRAAMLRAAIDTHRILEPLLLDEAERLEALDTPGVTDDDPP